MRPRSVRLLLIALTLCSYSGVATAEKPRKVTARKAPTAATPPSKPAPRGWSEAYPSVRSDLEAGKPLVIHVTVPLCSNSQIDCGASWAGQPGRLSTNLYWGAIFGARRIFDGKRSGWERVEVTQQDDVYLERVVYRRFVSAKNWNLSRCATRGDAKCEVEQLVILQAVHGDKIDRAVDDLWKHATEGATVGFVDPTRPEGKRRRSETIHVAGYAGHNRLMDGKRLPSPNPEEVLKRKRPARAAFVLACYSDRYFSDSLEQAGSTNLVSTQTLMAPEGYLVDAVAKGLGENDSDHALTERAIRTYAKWQRISIGQARQTFRAAKR